MKALGFSLQQVHVENPMRGSGLYVRRCFSPKIKGSRFGFGPLLLVSGCGTFGCGIGVGSGWWFGIQAALGSGACRKMQQVFVACRLYVAFLSA